MKILHINANPKPIEESNSRQLTREFFDSLLEHNPNVEVTHINLIESPPPYYNYNTYRYFWYPLSDPDYKPGEEEKKSVEYAKEQIGLFKSADVLVITSPMWNFSVPAILKAWQDQVLAPNEVFSVGPDGLKYLHNIKKIVLLISSGGVYEGKREWMDSLVSQIKAAFGYVGIKDYDVAWANGQNSFFFDDSDERKKKAMYKARDLGKKVAEEYMPASVQRNS